MKPCEACQGNTTRFLCSTCELEANIWYAGITGDSELTDYTAIVRTASKLKLSRKTVEQVILTYIESL